MCIFILIIRINIVSEYFYEIPTNDRSFIDTDIIELPITRVRRLAEPIPLPTSTAAAITAVSSTISTSNITVQQKNTTIQTVKPNGVTSKGTNWLLIVNIFND